MTNSQQTHGQESPVRIWSAGVESEEFDDSPPVCVGRPVLVLLPFLDGRIRDSKSQQFSQLRHRQREVDAFLAQVFAEGFWVAWVAAQLLEM